MTASTATGRGGLARTGRTLVLGVMIACLGIFAFSGSAKADPFGIGLNDGLAKVSNAEISAAKIGTVKVKGPKRIRKGRIATYSVRIKNTGNATATGVRLKVSGRGLSVSTSVADIGAGNSRTTTVTVRPTKKGKIRAKFRVTSENAGSKTVRKTVIVTVFTKKVPVTG